MSDDWDDYLEQLFEPDPRDYEDILFGPPGDYDPQALELFGEWMESGFTDDNAFQRINDYMWDKYGIDFDDVFDYEDFQDWYDSQ